MFIFIKAVVKNDKAAISVQSAVYLLTCLRSKGTLGKSDMLWSTSFQFTLKLSEALDRSVSVMITDYWIYSDIAKTKN